jgi:hypothetical protein
MLLDPLEAHMHATMIARFRAVADAVSCSGRAVAELTAYSKGQRLGLFEPSPDAVRMKREQARKETGAFSIDLLGRAVPVVHTKGGLRALSKETPIKPESVERYLSSKFRATLQEATAAMCKLALFSAGRQARKRELRACI